MFSHAVIVGATYSKVESWETRHKAGVYMREMKKESVIKGFVRPHYLEVLVHIGAPAPPSILSS